MTVVIVSGGKPPHQKMEIPLVAMAYVLLGVPVLPRPQDLGHAENAPPGMPLRELIGMVVICFQSLVIPRLVPLILKPTRSPPTSWLE